MELSDILSATGVILVFIMLTFDKLNSTANDALKLKVPEKIKKIEFDSYCSLITSILLRTIFSFLGLLFLSYIFLPTTLNIITTSTFNLWNFNLLNTLFVIIEVCVLAMTIYIATLCYKIYKKRKSYN